MESRIAGKNVGSGTIIVCGNNEKATRIYVSMSEINAFVPILAKPDSIVLLKLDPVSDTGDYHGHSAFIDAVLPVIVLVAVELLRTQQIQHL